LYKGSNPFGLKKPGLPHLSGHKETWLRCQRECVRMPLTRPAYPSEFKAEAVRLYRTSGRSLKEIARNLGEHDLEELKHLRCEVRILREKREILRKAIAFFAKKTNHIVTIYRESRGLYGVPRVQADLRSRYQIRCSKRRVSRLMGQAGLADVNRGKKRQLSKRDASKTASTW
jgi:transposase